MKELSAKQKKFVQEWLIDFNGTRAALRAGYSEKSAAQTASRLMKDLREYVESGQWQFDAKGALKALDMLHGMMEKLGARDEDEGGSDEDMIASGGREF